MQTFTYHQMLSAILPFFLVCHDDFSIYLVDKCTCVECWETKRLQTKQRREFELLHLQHFGIRTFTRQIQAHLTHCAKPTFWAMKARINTDITEDYNALFCLHPFVFVVWNPLHKFATNGSSNQSQGSAIIFWQRVWHHILTRCQGDKPIKIFHW